MTLHLHTELVPGCYRCDLSRHEAETIFAEQAACLHPAVTCDECGAEITAPLLQETIEHHPDTEAANEIAHIVMDVLGWQNLHLTDWQRGYQAGAREARTQASITINVRLLRVLTVDVLALLAATALLLATGWPWIAAITGVLTLAYGWLRWAVARRVRSLRAHLKEDQ